MKRSDTRVALTASIAIAVALASTCDMPPTFGDEYYDTGINYIAAYPFADPPLPSDDDTVVAYNIAARWDWPWRGQMGTDYPYMTLTDTLDIVGTVQTSGSHTLAADEEIWRLELANLFTIGHFQGSPDMTPISVSTGDSITLDSTVFPIHGQSLKLLINNADNGYMEWDMQDLLNDLVTTTITVSPSYFLRMLAYDNKNINYANVPVGTVSTLIPDLEAQPITPVIIDASTYSFFLSAFSGFGEGNHFALLASVYNTSFDEVRAVRSDMKPSIRLRLRPSDTYPSLVPGQYEFSVWVRTAALDRRFDDSSRESEPYAACNVSLGIAQVGGKSIVSESAVGATWTRVAVRMQSPDNLDYFNPLTPDAVMELSITPSSVTDLDAGALEIAAPALNFYVDGF